MDCCSFSCRGTDHFTVAGASFGSRSRVTFSLRRHIECVVRWGRARIARDGPLRSRFLLLLPAPAYSLAAKPEEIPRFVIFMVSTLFVGTLSAAQRSATESLRRARDDLKGTVQELQTTNEALHAESLERKHAEEALYQAQADLARVSRVTTMGELTASLAHEVNQPIAAAVTNANTCLRWLTREHPDVEEARAAAMRIVKDGTRAAEIIKRTRLLFKKGTSQRESLDVNEVVREMIVLLRSEAARNNISVRTELAADLPRVMGDRVQLQQVLMNLMLNGIDAMKTWMGRSTSPSNRSERKTSKFSYPSAIPVWVCRYSRRTRSSRHFLPPSLMALGWDCPSVAPSLNRMAGACGLRRTLRAAQAFVSLYPPTPRQRNELRRLILG